MKVFTAEQFRKQPAPVYRAADKASLTGDKVVIKHNSYSGTLFELTAVSSKEGK